MYFFRSLVTLCERGCKHVEEQHINALKSTQGNCLKCKNRYYWLLANVIEQKSLKIIMYIINDLGKYATEKNNMK